MDNYYFLDGQNRMGPYAGEMIWEFRERGTLGDDDYLWREGLPDWITVGEAFAPDGELYRLDARVAADDRPKARDDLSKGSGTRPADSGRSPGVPVPVIRPLGERTQSVASTLWESGATGNVEDEQKHQYIKSIRANTTYPAYRAMIGILAMLGYGMALFNGVITFVSVAMAMDENYPPYMSLIVLLVGFGFTVIIYYAVQFFKEIASMIADIADSITDANSQNK